MPEQAPSDDHTTEPAPALLTITEAAELLRAPVATLRYWRHLGTGPTSFRLGRRVLYRRADLHSWIDAQADQSPRRKLPPRGSARRAPAKQSSRLTSHRLDRKSVVEGKRVD